MAKEPQELKWTEKYLPKGTIRKNMFGGFGYYLDDRMILCLMETYGERTYKGVSLNYDLWCGCLFPCERENHMTITTKFPFLFPHPVLGKWLYLPLSTENFDELAESVLKELLRINSLFGALVKKKKPKKNQHQPKISAASAKTKPQKKSPTKKTNKIKSDEFNLNGHRISKTPQMFSDEPTEDIFTKVTKISELKNLGPVTEKTFHKAGIKNAAQFKKLGWKKTFKKIIAISPKNHHSVFTYALIAALKNIEIGGLSEEDKAQARTFTQSLKPRKKTKRRPIN